MTTKRKALFTFLAILFIALFIYIPLRTGILEKQLVKYLISSAEKIVISLSSFDKDKRLQKKDLTQFYSIIKDRYPIAMITIADKKNKILKAGKNEKYIKSNKTFDTIIDGFTKDEFRVHKKNDFIIRYFDQKRFYIFSRNIAGGKILLVFPYKLSTKTIIKLVLEISLIFIFSLIITAIVFIIKNKRCEKPTKAEIDHIEDIKKASAEPEEQLTKEDQNIHIREIKQTAETVKLDLDSLTDHVYGLFSYISREYKSENMALYLFNNDSAGLNKIFELKGKSFLKIEDLEFEQARMSGELIEELKNSSIIMLDKGKKVTIPVMYKNILLGLINIIRNEEFKGPEINDIKSRLITIARPLGELILLDALQKEKAAVEEIF